MRLRWRCEQCGHIYNPMKCKLEIAETMIPKRVIIFCPNPGCGSWLEVCDVLEIE